MSKRFFILILCISLVLGSSVPVFAVSTDSAIKLKSVTSLSDVRATGSDYSQDIYNYIVGTNGFPAVSSGLTAIRNLITNHFYRNSGFTLYNWGAQAGISTYTSGNGYFSNYFGSAFTNLSSLLASAAEQVWDTKQYLIQQKSIISDIHEVLTTDGGISLDIGDSFKYPWGYYNYYKTNKTVTLSRVNENGNYYTQGVYTNNLDYFGMIQYWIVEHVRNMAYGVTTITGNVKNGANSDVLTNTDLTTAALEHDSMWDDLDHIGANLSAHLARLAFVLASDEEIAARQAAAANTDQVVDDFINSSGSASASTSDFADVASAGSAMKNALSSNVSPTNAFTSLSSTSSAWDWFSQATADSLDSTPASNSRRGSSTPYLDSYYNDLLETLMLR